MKPLVLTALLTLFTPLISAQQPLIPNNLPACAAQCTILQNAQTSCQSNPSAATTCFCQSSLLGPLYANLGAQLCPSCSSADIQTIQTWYQGFCKNPTAANENTPTTTTSTSTSQSATSKATSTPSGAAATGASQQSTTNSIQGPWFSTHWRWVVMLIVLALGLSLVAVVGTLWHRRYRRKRELRFSGGLGSHQPNINTWGPGQSVHDLGFINGASAPYQEKGKGREQTRRIDEPAPTRMREMRLDNKF